MHMKSYKLSDFCNCCFVCDKSRVNPLNNTIVIDLCKILFIDDPDSEKLKTLALIWSHRSSFELVMLYDWLLFKMLVYFSV